MRVCVLYCIKLSSLKVKPLQCKRFLMSLRIKIIRISDPFNWKLWKLKSNFWKSPNELQPYGPIEEHARVEHRPYGQRMSHDRMPVHTTHVARSQARNGDPLCVGQHRLTHVKELSAFTCCTIVQLTGCSPVVRVHLAAAELVQPTGKWATRCRSPLISRSRVHTLLCGLILINRRSINTSMQHTPWVQGQLWGICQKVLTPIHHKVSPSLPPRVSKCMRVLCLYPESFELWR